MKIIGDTRLDNALEAGLAELIRRSSVPGAALAIEAQRVSGAAAAGLLSSRDDIPLSAGHRLPISCVMKIIVALLVLHGDEHGLLDIEDDAAD